MSWFFGCLGILRGLNLRDQTGFHLPLIFQRNLWKPVWSKVARFETMNVANKRGLYAIMFMVLVVANV